MNEADATTRQRIRDALAADPRTPSALAAGFDITVGGALDHVEHVARSLESEPEELEVAPPRCRDCGFDRFDDLLNVPSRCPECKSEDVAEPAFRIR